jgi:hypothetical protein
MVWGVPMAQAAMSATPAAAAAARTTRAWFIDHQRRRCPAKSPPRAGAKQPAKLARFAGGNQTDVRQNRQPRAALSSRRNPRVSQAETQPMSGKIAAGDFAPLIRET